MKIEKEKEKEKKKRKHGLYYLENSKGFFTFNSYLRKGRAFLAGDKVIEISLKTHPKVVKVILDKGTVYPASKSTN